ncbi:MAG: acyltransferase family protein [Blastocatellia bacterium]
MNTKRIHTLDALRGIASLAVCWFHLTNGNPAFLPDGWLKLSGKFGWLGVEMFFVISGFIIPFSMRRAGYSIGDFPRFILKRIVRLDPPYLVAIVLTIGLAYLSSLAPGFRGAATVLFGGASFITFGIRQCLLWL